MSSTTGGEPLMATQTTTADMTALTENEFLVFSDDWGRHPSSCQHLIGSLLNETKVTWVNTIGSRPPRLDIITIKRAAEKIRGWVSGEQVHLPKSDIPDNLNVIDAKMWPWMTHAWDRQFNKCLLSKQVARKARGSTVLTTIPLVADLINTIPAKNWVYYCVDDFSVWPGLDHKAMKCMEQRMMTMADTVIAVSKTLQNKVLQHRNQCDLLTHGVHLDHWRDERDSFDWPKRNIPSPVYLFWGVIDQRMATSWIAELSNQMNTGSIVLAGPEQNPDPKLLEIPRVKRLGAIAYDDLPTMAASADVLIMPYKDSPVTRAMQPLKMKEYLATGKPVIARKLPALEEWSDCSSLVTSALEFAKRVIEGETQSDYQEQLINRQRLNGESWDQKARQLVKMIETR